MQKNVFALFRLNNFEDIMIVIALFQEGGAKPVQGGGQNPQQYSRYSRIEKQRLYKKTIWEHNPGEGLSWLSWVIIVFSTSSLIASRLLSWLWNSKKGVVAIQPKSCLFVYMYIYDDKYII